MSEMIERVARAMRAEEERWRCITGGTGMQDVIVRDDDDGDPVEVSRHPQGDGDMWFWDTRNRAVAGAAIKAMREPTLDMVQRGAEDADPVGCCLVSPSNAADVWGIMIDTAIMDKSHDTP